MYFPTWMLDFVMAKNVWTCPMDLLGLIKVIRCSRPSEVAVCFGKVGNFVGTRGHSGAGGRVGTSVTLHGAFGCIYIYIYIHMTLTWQLKCWPHSNEIGISDVKDNGHEIIFMTNPELLSMGLTFLEKLNTSRRCLELLKPYKPEPSNYGRNNHHCGKIYFFSILTSQHLLNKGLSPTPNLRFKRGFP